jgi:hypothetical protein
MLITAKNEFIALSITLLRKNRKSKVQKTTNIVKRGKNQCCGTGTGTGTVGTVTF